MTKDKKRFLQFLFVLLIIFFGVISIYAYTQRVRFIEAYDAQITSNDKLKHYIKAKQLTLNQEAYNAALNSPNKKIRMNVRQAKVTTDVKKVTNKLFKVLLTYDSSDVYNSRADNSTDYVTDNVLKNKKLYESDLENGTHLVDASGLESQFISTKVSVGLLKDDDLPVMIKATFRSGYKGQNKNITSDIFVGVYSTTQNKFKQVTRLDNIYRGNESVNND